MVNEHTQRRTRGIRLGIFAGMIQFGVVAIVQFSLIRVIIEHLGKEGYGAWSLLTLVVYWSALFDFGLSKGLLNSLADANGHEDRNKAIVSTSTAFAVLAGVTIIGTCCAWIGTYIWGAELLNYFKLDKAGASVWILGSVGTAFFVNMPLSIFAQIYWAYQLRHIAVVFLVISSLSTLALEILGAHFHLGLNWMVVLFIMPMVAGTALSGVYLFVFKMPWIRPRLRSVKLEALHEMGSTSFGYFCFGMLGFMINETQPSIIARIGTLALTAEWQIITRIILALSAPIQMSTFSFVPALREAVSNGDHQWMVKAFRSMAKIRMLGAIAGTIILYFFGPFVLKLLGKNTSIEFTQTTWLIIMFSVIVFTWNSCYTDLFSIMDNIWYMVLAAGLNAVTVLWLTAHWVPTIGLRGALQAYVALPLLVFSWAMPILAKFVIFREKRHEA